MKTKRKMNLIHVLLIIGVTCILSCLELPNIVGESHAIDSYSTTLQQEIDRGERAEEQSKYLNGKPHKRKPSHISRYRRE